MKGLILSGGAGTRLRPITHTSAKQLVPIANKPILFYGIERLAGAGINDIGIIIGETGDEIRAAVGDGSRWGIRVNYLPQEAPLGLAHCVLIARDFLGDDDFVMYLGDNMLEQDLIGMVDRFRADRAAGDLDCRILLKKVDDPRSFGVAVIDTHGTVSGLIEKPADPPSDLALVGVYLFTPAIHEAVRAIEPSDRAELEITDAIQWLIDNGRRVDHDTLDGWWIDTGKKDPLLACNRLVLDSLAAAVDPSAEIKDASKLHGRVLVGAGAVVIDSTITGPAIIGQDAVVTGSRIDPYTAIGDQCTIIDARIGDSVLLRGCRVEGTTSITSSLFGRNSRVVRSTVADGSTSMMLGDDSIVELP